MQTEIIELKTYSRTSRKVNVSGYSISITKRYRQGDGEPHAYSVTIRGTTRANTMKRIFVFATADEAQAVFDNAIRDPHELFKTPQHSVEAYLEIAEKIVMKNVPYTGQVNLFLLLAIDRYKSNASSRDYRSIADIICRLLESNVALPNFSDELGFRRWLKECCHILMTKNIDEKKVTVAVDTASSRIMFLKRAFKVLVDYSDLISGAKLYLALAAKAPSICEEALSLGRKNLTMRDTYKPLTKSEIERFLNEAPTVALKFLILKTLALGSRPDEARRASYAHVVQGKITLREIVGKTEKYKDRIANPQASTALRLILRLETELGVVLRNQDNVWLKKKSNFCLRELRTTTACHVLFSGAGIDVVKERLSHVNLEMAIHHYNHYNLYNITDVANMRPQNSYELPEKAVVGGLDILSYEHWAFDKYLIVLLLKMLQSSFGPEREAIAKIMIDEVREDFAEKKAVGAFVF